MVMGSSTFPRGRRSAAPACGGGGHMPCFKGFCPTTHIPSVRACLRATRNYTGCWEMPVSEELDFVEQLVVT